MTLGFFNNFRISTIKLKQSERKIFLLDLQFFAELKYAANSFVGVGQKIGD